MYFDGKLSLIHTHTPIIDYICELMKIVISLVIVCGILAPKPVWSQLEKIEKVSGENLYEFSEGYYTIGQLDQILLTNIDASNKYKIGTRWTKWGTLQYYTGGLVFGYTTYLMLTEGDGADVGRSFLIGTALVTTGITSIIIGKRKRRKAIDIYNNNIEAVSEIDPDTAFLTLISSGLALVYEF